MQYDRNFHAREQEVQLHLDFRDLDDAIEDNMFDKENS